MDRPILAGDNPAEEQQYFQDNPKAERGTKKPKKIKNLPLKQDYVQTSTEAMFEDNFENPVVLTKQQRQEIQKEIAIDNAKKITGYMKDYYSDPVNLQVDEEKKRLFEVNKSLVIMDAQSNQAPQQGQESTFVKPQRTKQYELLQQEKSALEHKDILRTSDKLLSDFVARFEKEYGKNPREVKPRVTQYYGMPNVKTSDLSSEQQDAEKVNLINDVLDIFRFKNEEFNVGNGLIKTPQWLLEGALGISLEKENVANWVISGLPKLNENSKIFTDKDNELMGFLKQSLEYQENQRMMNRTTGEEIMQSVVSTIGALPAYVFGLGELKAINNFKAFNKAFFTDLVKAPITTGFINFTPKTLQNLRDATSTGDVLLAPLKAYWDNFTEVLGETATPVVAKFIPGLNKAINNVLGKVGQKYNRAIQRVLLQPPLESFENEVTSLFNRDPNVFEGDLDAKRLTLSLITSYVTGFGFAAIQTLQRDAYVKGVLKQANEELKATVTKDDLLKMSDDELSAYAKQIGIMTSYKQFVTNTSKTVENILSDPQSQTIVDTIKEEAKDIATTLPQDVQQEINTNFAETEVAEEVGLQNKYVRSNIDPNKAKTIEEQYSELFGNMPRQGQVADVLDMVQEKTQNKVEPEVYGILKDIARETGTRYNLDIADIMTANPEYREDFLASSRAIAYQKANIIGFNLTLPIREKYSKDFPVNIGSDWVHEMIHIGLRNKLTDYKGENNDPELQNELIRIIADFENYVFKLKPDFKHGQDSKYAMQPMEFLNYVFQTQDNPFVTGLKQMSSPDRQSLLNRFFDWVRKALGLKTKNAYDYTKDLLMKHLNEQLESVRGQVEYTKYDDMSDADIERLFGQGDYLSSPLFKPNFKQENMDILTARSSALDYTQDQITALQMTEAFLKDENANFMLLEGYAGTGKTTLVENLINYARGSKFISSDGGTISAITNKAVRVLDSKLLNVRPRVDGITLHGLLYMPQDLGKGRVKFEVGEGSIDGLLIVDEASMISNGSKNENIRIFQDIIDTAIRSQAKVIFLGDSFQLPPVESTFNIFKDASHVFNNYHAMMSQVKRIKGGTILDYVTALRMRKNVLFVPNESSGNLVVSNAKTAQNSFNELILAGEDAIFVTATNKMRIKINFDAMKLKFPNRKGGNIYQGEPMLVVNNANPVFKNGEILNFGEDVEPIGQFQFRGQNNYGKVSYSNFYAIEHNKQLFLFSSDSELASVHIGQLKYGLGEEQWKKLDALYLSILKKHGRSKESVDALESRGKKGMSQPEIGVLYPAYAITAHKSQGSQWKHVFVNQDYVFPGNVQDSVRWLYTAATRASEKLTLVPTNSHRTARWEQIDELLATQDVHKEIKGKNPSSFGVPKGYTDPVEEKVIEIKQDTELVKSVSEDEMAAFLNELETKKTEESNLVLKIISGGQTGVDRIGLEVGKALGIKTGGHAPKGYKTDIGNDVSLKELGLVEDSSSNYPPRTEKNIINSDGTILFGNMTSPGSLLTIKLAKKHYKPYIINPSAKEIQKFIKEYDITTVNIAGNRAKNLTTETQKRIFDTLKEGLSVPKKNQKEVNLTLSENIGEGEVSQAETTTPFSNNTSLKKEYQGKLIYSTPGTGKTNLTKQFPEQLTDFDDLLVAVIKEHNPKADVNNDTLGKYIYDMYAASDKMDRVNKNKIEAQIEAYYNAALVSARKVVKSGRSVLTGSTRFLLDSDVAFISNDPVIIARRYNENVEKLVAGVIRKQQEKLEFSNDEQEVIFLKDGEVLYDKIVQDIETPAIETPIGTVQNEVKEIQQEVTESKEELLNIQTQQTMENVPATTEPVKEEVESTLGVDPTDAEKLLSEEPTEEQEEVINQSSLSTNNLVQEIVGADGKPIFPSYEALYDFVQDTSTEAGRDDIASFDLFLDLLSEKAGFVGRGNERIRQLNALYEEKDKLVSNGRSWLHTQWHSLINKVRKNLAIIEIKGFNINVKKINSDRYSDSQGKSRSIIQQGLTYSKLVKDLAKRGFTFDFYEVSHFANLPNTFTKDGKKIVTKGYNAKRITQLKNENNQKLILDTQRNLIRNGYVLILESKLAGVIDLKSINFQLGNIKLKWNEPQYSDYVKKNKAEYWNFGKVVLADEKNSLFRFAVQEMGRQFPEFKSRKVADYYESKTPQGNKTISDYVVNYNKYKNDWQYLRRQGFDDAIMTNIVSDIIHQFVFRGLFWGQILPSAGLNKDGTVNASKREQQIMKRIQLGGNLSTATLTKDIIANLPNTSVGNPIWIDKSDGISRVKLRAATLSEDIKFKVGDFTFVDGSQYVLPEFAQVYNDANIVDYDKRGTALKARQFEIDLFKKYAAFVVVPGTPLYKFMIDNSIAVIEPESTIKIGRMSNPMFNKAPYIDYEDITNGTIVPTKTTYELDLKNFAYIENTGKVKTENRDLSTWLWSVGTTSILKPTSLTALNNLHKRSLNSLQSKIQNWHNPDTFAKTIYRTYSSPNSFDSTTKNFVLDFLKEPKYKYMTYYPQLVDNFLSSTFTEELQSVLKFKQYGSRPVLKLETFGMEDVPNLIKGFNNKTDDEKEAFFNNYCEKHSDGSHSLKEGFVIIDNKMATVLKVGEGDRVFTVCNPASDFSDTRAVTVVGVGKVNYSDNKMIDGNWIMGSTKTFQIMSGKDGDKDPIGFIPVDYLKKNDKFTDKDLETIWKDIDAVYKSGKVQAWFDKFEEGYAGKAKAYNQQMKRHDIDAPLARIIDWFGASEEMKSGVNLYNPEQTAEMMSMLITNQIGIVYNARRLFGSISEIGSVELHEKVANAEGIVQDINLKIEVVKDNLGENLVFLRHLSHYVLDALSNGKVFSFNFSLPMIYNKIFKITNLDTGKQTTLDKDNYAAFKQFEEKNYLPFINLTKDIEKEGIYQGIEQYNKLLTSVLKTLETNPFKDTFIGKFVGSLSSLEIGKLKLTGEEVRNIEEKYRENVYSKKLRNELLNLGSEQPPRKMVRRFNYILNRLQTVTNSSTINRHKPSKQGNLWTDDAIFRKGYHETVNNLIKLRQNCQDLAKSGKTNNPLVHAYINFITDIFKGNRYLMFDGAKGRSFVIAGKKLLPENATSSTEVKEEDIELVLPKKDISHLQIAKNNPSLQVYSFVNYNGTLEYRYDFYLNGRLVEEQSFQKDNWYEFFQGVHAEQLTSIIMKDEYKFLEKMFDKHLEGAMVQIEKNNNIYSQSQKLVKELYRELVDSDDFKSLSSVDQRAFFELTTGIYDKESHRYGLIISTELLKSIVESREVDEFEMLAYEKDPDYFDKRGEELSYDADDNPLASKITRTNNVLNSFTLANSVTDINSVANEFVNDHLTALNNVISVEMGFEDIPNNVEDWVKFEELGNEGLGKKEETDESIEDIVKAIEKEAGVPTEKYDIIALAEASFNLKLTTPKVIKYVSKKIKAALKQENRKTSLTRGIHNIIPIPEIINADSKKVNVSPTFNLKGGIDKIWVDDFVNIQEIQAFEINAAFNTIEALGGISLWSNAQLAFLKSTYIERHVLEKESYFRQIFNNGVVRVLESSSKGFPRLSAREVFENKILEDAYDIAAGKDFTDYLRGFDINTTNVKAIIESLEQGYTIRYGIDKEQQRIEKTYPQTLFKVNQDNLVKLAREYYNQSPHLAKNEGHALNSIAVAIIYRLVFDKVIPDLISVHVRKLEWLLNEKKDTIKNSMLSLKFIDNITESLSFWNKMIADMNLKPMYMPEFEKNATDKEREKSEPVESLLESEITRDPFDVDVSAFETESDKKENILKDSKMLNRFLNTIGSVMRKQLFEGYRLADLEKLSSETPFIQNVMSRQIAGTLDQHEYLRKAPVKSLKIGQDAMIETDNVIAMGTITKIEDKHITLQWKDVIYNKEGVQEVLVQGTYSIYDIRNSFKYVGVNIQADIARVFRKLDTTFGKGFLKDKVHLADFGDSLSDAITLMSKGIIKTGSKAMLGFKPLFQLTNYVGGTINQLVYFGATTYFNHQAPIDLRTFTQSNDLKKSGAVSEHDINIYRQVTNNMSRFMGNFEYILGSLGDTIINPETATRDELEFIEKTRGATNIFKLVKELANLRKTFARITSKAEPDEGSIQDLINFSKRFDRFYNKAGLYNIPLGWLFQKKLQGAAPYFSDMLQGEREVRSDTAGTMITYIIERSNKLNEKLPDDLTGSLIPRIALASVDNCVKTTQFYYTGYLDQSFWGSDPFTKMFEWFAHYPVSMSFNFLHTIFNTIQQFKDFGGRRVIASSYFALPKMRTKQQILNQMFTDKRGVKLYDVEKNEIIESINVTSYKGENNYSYTDASGKQHIFKYANLNQLNKLIRMLGMATLTFVGTTLNTTFFRKIAYDFMYIKSYSIFYQLFTDPLLRSQSVPVIDALMLGLSQIAYETILQRTPVPEGDSKKEQEAYKKAQSLHEKLFDVTNKDKFLYKKRTTMGDEGSKVHKNDESDEIMAAYAFEFQQNLIGQYTKSVVMGVGAQKMAELTYMILANHYTQEDLKPYMWNSLQMIIPAMRLTSSIGGALVRSGSNPYGIAGKMESPLGLYEKKSDELMNRRYKRNYLEKLLEESSKAPIPEKLSLEERDRITKEKDELKLLIQSETKK